MKIGMSEAAARKTLAALGQHPTDPDLVLVRERLEQGLKAATAGGHLTAQELKALLTIAQVSSEQIGRMELSDPDRVERHLATAIPKLKALLDRAESGW